jgi:hypothetical protein
MWCAFVAAFAMMSLLLWCNLTPSLSKVSFGAAAALVAAAVAVAGPMHDTWWLAPLSSAAVNHMGYYVHLLKV